MDTKSLYLKLSEYARPSSRKSIFQLFSNLIAYFALIYGMYWLLSQGYSYWWVLLVSLPAAGFMVRIFIIFHDCTHGSYFKSRKANAIIGHICGILTFTTYSEWKYQHEIHHGTAGNLDKRGIGDVWTMTVEEYNSSSKFIRLVYRTFRNPIFLFIVLPSVLFYFINRFPGTHTRRKDEYSLNITNIGVIAIILLAWLFIGLKSYIFIQLPILFFATMAGMWLFYMQHQFETVYWDHNESWEFVRAALEGSSYLKLPFVLRFFSGNIGYHNLHHLNARIPNYNLKKAYEAITELRETPAITFFQSMRFMFLHLYDTKTKMLLSFRQAKAMRSD